MITQKLRQLLDEHQIKYRVIEHSPAYTALEIAEAAHESGKDLVKTVMLDVDDKMIMYVLPASQKVDFEHVRAAMEASKVYLSSEEEFKALFPDCEIGAMPPFGGLYNVKMMVDKSLAHNEWIVFNAGNHFELIKMRYQDFDELIHPHKWDYVSLIV